MGTEADWLKVDESTGLVSKIGNSGIGALTVWARRVLFIPEITEDSWDILDSSIVSNANVKVIIQFAVDQVATRFRVTIGARLSIDGDGVWAGPSDIGSPGLRIVTRSAGVNTVRASNGSGLPGSIDTEFRLELIVKGDNHTFTLYNSDGTTQIEQVTWNGTSTNEGRIGIGIVQLGASPFTVNTQIGNITVFGV